MKFNKADMVNEAKEIRAFIRENGRLPNSATMKDSTGKEVTLKKNEYLGLFKNQTTFFQANGRLPNYTALLYESSTAFSGQKQPNSWTCGSTSLSNAATHVFTYVSEKQCREACKTNTNGTVPDNLVAGGKKLGLQVKPIQRTLNAVRSTINSGGSVIAHIETAGKTRPACLGFKNNFGHYISIYDVTSDMKFKVFCPTMGAKTCLANQIINATNGRGIKFYSVKPLN